MLGIKKFKLKKNFFKQGALIENDQEEPTFVKEFRE